MDPLSLGRSCYKQGDYEGALAAFTEASFPSSLNHSVILWLDLFNNFFLWWKGINISTGHILLTALDHRAATFEKLKQLQPALRDAKDMIELKPGLAKGYLRCAKVLQLKGEESLALQIYERGLRKVKVGGDLDRPVLQDMFNKLQRKQTPAKSFDPMVMLPPELAQMVCESLDMRDRVICLAVSGPWKRFLEASHDLWTVLDMRSARRFVRLDSLKAHLRRSNYGLDRAFLNMNPQVFGGKSLEVLTRLCKKLTYLEITSTGYLGASLLSALPKAQNLRILIIKGAEMPLLSVAKALSSCPQLQTAEFHVVKYSSHIIWPQLDSLTSLRLELRGHCNPDPFCLDRLISCTPNLQSVILAHQENSFSHHAIYRSAELSLWSKLEHLEFTRACFSILPSLPPTLKHLDISENYILPSLLSMDESVTRIHLPQLETFICSGIDFSLEVVLTLIGPSVKAGNLKALHMGDYGPSDGSWEQSSPEKDLMMPNLRDLSLRKCQMREDAIVRFLRLCPNLQYVDVSLTRVTGVAIKELMTREIGPLKWLCANGCMSLSSDAVEWARSLGTIVEYYNDPPKRPSGQKFWRDRLS